MELVALLPSWQARIAMLKRVGDTLASALCYTERYDRSVPDIVRKRTIEQGAPDLAVLEVAGIGFTVTELAPGVEYADVAAKTAAPVFDGRMTCPVRS